MITGARRSEDGEPIRSVAQLNMLHSLAARLNGLKEIEPIAEAITAELRTLIEYHSCRVFLLQPDAETLYPVAFRGELTEYREETAATLTTRVGEGLTGHVAETLESYYSPDATHDAYAVLIPGTAELDESILAVPLASGRHLIGVLVLSKLGIDRFDEDDMLLLEVLASHSAVALENARLFGLERESASMARESEARKSAILESALDGIIVIDGRGIVEEFSPAAARTFGYTKEQAVGRELAELIIPPRFREDHRRGLARYLATGTAPILGKRIEAMAMRADGSEFPVELAITRVDVPDANLYTGYVRDITDRKRAEAEVEAALDSEREVAERLRVLDEMKDTFLQAVSHDLRTPLAAVLGLALTLDRTDLDLPAEVQGELTGRLAANARKLDRLLSNLLDLERLKRGVVEASLEPADVAELVRRVVTEADFLSGREVVVHADVAEASIDPAKVERIVENLLVNAAKHTPDDSTIWVELISNPDWVQINIEDEGAGVPSHLRAAIFEPFQRGSDETSSPGAGIGLSLVARFTSLHGGEAWVEDREGGGASFRVRLPRDPTIASGSGRMRGRSLSGTSKR